MPQSNTPILVGGGDITDIDTPNRTGAHRAEHRLPLTRYGSGLSFS